MAEQPNDASRKSKAEGERFEEDAAAVEQPRRDTIWSHETVPPDTNTDSPADAPTGGRDERRSER